MQKKSQSLPISVIILAALGLIVLIVMVLIFTGQVKVFSKNIGCGARNGICMSDLVPSRTSCPSEKPVVVYTQNCVQVGGESAGQKPGQCCIALE